MSDIEKTFLGLATSIRDKVAVLKERQPDGPTADHIEKLGLQFRSHDDRLRSIDRWVARLTFKQTGGPRP